MPTSLVHTIAVDHILLPQAFHNYFLRRFISMYGDVVLHIPNEEFERCINRLKKEKNVELDVDLSADDLQTLTTRYKVKWHTQSFVLCCRSINHRDAHDSSVCLTKNWVAVTAGSTAVTAGSTAVTAGSTGVTAGSTAVTAGSTGVTAGSTCVTAGSTAVTTGSTGITAGSATKEC